MGLLVDGTWRDQWYDTSATGGRFVRGDSQFRNWITPDGKAGPTGSDGFKAEVTWGFSWPDAWDKSQAAQATIRCLLAEKRIPHDELFVELRTPKMCEDLFQLLCANGGPEQKVIIFCTREIHADCGGHAFSDSRLS